ncbi:tetratricopeptide repeat protein [Streptomyces canus]|uniref:tetratricopeptide repeat protein n=1 Tax=Streptomyces canus TaxID=58343 RepID=UPI002E2D390E|nr:tetratricopeptide repeat protein [Streptomyces canus]
MSLLPRPRRKRNATNSAHGTASEKAPYAASSVSAGAGGIAAGGEIKASALGDNSQVMYVEHQHVAQHATPVQWPVVVGTVPVLASAFQPRDGLRRVVDEARGHSRSVVLTSDNPADAPSAPGTPPTAQVMSGGGGVGKSQLAAAYAREAISSSADLVLWTPAHDVQQVLTHYAQAALLVQAPGRTGQDLETDARALMTWLVATDRRWLVVLDDVTDPDAIEPWWPDSQRGTGWTLATTRLKDPRLTGGGRTRIDVDVYTPTEATSYLTARLTHDRKAHLLDDQAPALAAALGYLPLAMGHAAAYMLRENTPCAAYLQQFTERAARLDELLPRWADTERYGRQITTTLLLALDATDKDPHGPLARVALRTNAFLDPAGHPAALWHTPTLTSHLTDGQRPDRPRRPRLRRRTSQPGVTGDDAHAALRLLDRYGLITYDTANDQHRSVRIHALTARAVRETVPEDQQLMLAAAAANALLELWPEIDQSHPGLAAALRANTDALADHTGDVLWQPDGHPVLFRVGNSLLDAGLAASATAYWQHMTTSSERLLGDDHPDTLTARGNLATSYQQAGRTSEAIELLEQVVADSQRLRGDDHPETLTARGNLASSYRRAGRTSEAIGLLEQVVADCERLLGEDHPTTLTARGNLASSYWQAGRTREAIVIEERVVANCERLLGDDHPSTLLARANLATSYQQAGRTSEAIELLEQVVADSQRLRGDDHPETLTARGNLATSYQQAGRTSEAIELLEQVVADHERLLGEDHPHTLTARGNLASSYWQAGRTREAIVIEERVVADSKRLRGDDHPHTLTARGNLATSYRRAGRTSEAIELLEQVVADHERLWGEDHPDTLTVRGNLASSYRRAGRTREAIVIEERVVANCERLLGSDHPSTLTARGNLAISYWQAGRTREAIVIEEQVAADSERLLGEDHPDTLTARANLATSYWQAGRTSEAIGLLEQVVADHERLLGEDHPHTLTARGNLATSYWQAGRTREAIVIEERVVADRERLLGEDHPDTLTARAAFSEWQALEE